MLDKVASSSETTDHVPDSTFKVEFFEKLFNLESNSFWFRGRNKIIIWALKKYFFSVATLLEVGCGTGFVIQAIGRSNPHLKLYGSELFSEGLHFAKLRSPTVKFMQLDARALPFRDSFDVIGCFDVLEHIDEDELVLEEFYRTCRQGIILTVPQHQFLWSAMDEVACHKRRYSAIELKRKVEKAGFKVIRQTSFISFLLPLMMLTRKKLKTEEQVDYSEFEIPKPIDLILEFIVDLEKLLIMLGVNFPMGGSLILIATKPGKDSSYSTRAQRLG